MVNSSRRRRSTFFVAPPLSSSSNSNSNLLMMEELDIEGDGNCNTMTALEVQVSTNDDSSSLASHSRTSDDSSSIVGPSSSKSDTNDATSPPLIPLPCNLKPDIPTKDCDVSRATMFNRQNSSSPQAPLPKPKKEKHPGRGHQQQQQLQQHFLHGINVESCQNLLSIPDPPTPGKVNHRRQSSPGPMLQPLPFDDLTHSSKANRQKIPKQGHMHADDSKVSMRSRQKPKRPRKSLSHIPSPVVPSDLDCDDDIQEKGTTEAAVESSHEPFDTGTNTLPGAHSATPQIADDIENSDADASVTKRRKKRQSIVLPSDTTTGTQEYFSTFMTYKKAPPTAREEEQPTASLCSMAQRPTAVNPRDFQELRKLVRSYTSLSYDARNNCQEIQDIRERTGYVLTPPLTSSDDLLHADLNIDDSWNANDRHQHQGKESLKESKMKLLVKMGPQLQRMDEKKCEQVQNTQHKTNCFVEKKRGRYLYYDVSSNRPIAPHLYEERYLLMLQDTHKIRSIEWTQHFQQAFEQATEVVPEVDYQSIIANKNENGQAAGQESPLEVRDDVNDNNDGSENMHESMDICETSTSFDLEGDLVDDSSDMNTNTSMNPYVTSSSKGGEIGQEIEIVLDEKGEFRALPSGMEGTVASPAGSDGESSVLPLPSREEESSDPEFAQAEQKLWAVIDQALDEYSRDILAIQTARRMEVPSNISS